jgi:hypothetical protein
MHFEIKRTGLDPHHIADAIIDALQLKITDRNKLASDIPSPQHAEALQSVIEILKEFHSKLKPENQVQANKMLMSLIERASEKNLWPQRKDIPVDEYVQTIKHFIDATSCIFHEPASITPHNGLSFISFITRKHFNDRNTNFYPSYKIAIQPFGHLHEEQFQYVPALFGTIQRHNSWLQSDRGALERAQTYIFSENPFGTAIRKGFNTFSSTYYGIGDFVTLCQAAKVSPQSINRLIWIARSVPSLDPTFFSKNRSDALFFDEHFQILRKAIHYQVPRVHELLGCIIDHYEQRTETTRRALDSVTKDQPSSIKALLEQSLKDERIDLLDEKHSTGGDMTGIKMAHQLFEQTKPVKETPPKTTIETLNTAMQQMHTYGTQLPLHELQGTLAAINSVLAGFITNETYGIDPSLITGILWTERAIVQRLQTISFEEQEALPFSDLYTELLHFYYLTSSVEPYSNELMAEHLSSIQSHRTSHARIKEACQQMLLNAASLAKEYRKDGEPFWADSVISGNLVDVFVDLLSPREASTAVGKRIRSERIEQYHSGD